MPLQITTDHAEITALLDRFLAKDPVAGTILGTIRAVLEPSAWAASTGDLLCVRSGASYPVVLAGRWDAAPAAMPELAVRLRSLPGLRGVSGPVTVVDALAGELVGDRPVDRMGQRLFRCDELIRPSGVPGVAVAADESHRALVREWFTAFVQEAGARFGRAEEWADRALDQGTCWLWLDAGGAPVSLAARRPVAGGSARIGPVYTPPDARGRGYGSAVTAAATAEVLGIGAIPVLFTDLANPTSNKIYQLIGYRPVEDRAVHVFS